MLPYYVFKFQLQIYERYLEEHITVLEEINLLFSTNSRFETLYREFESQKVCHLPVTAFILKPLQRLLHYSQILESEIFATPHNIVCSHHTCRNVDHSVHSYFLTLGLLKYYGKNHPHYEDCFQAKMVLVNVAKFVPKILRKSVSQDDL